jgi:hypothetical protein
VCCCSIASRLAEVLDSLPEARRLDAKSKDTVRLKRRFDCTHTVFCVCQIVDKMLPKVFEDFASRGSGSAGSGSGGSGDVHEFLREQKCAARIAQALAKYCAKFR